MPCNILVNKADVYIVVMSSGSSMYNSRIQNLKIDKCRCRQYIMTSMHGARKVRQVILTDFSGPTYACHNILVQVAINVFHRGPYGPPSRSNWNRGVPYQNYKGNIWQLVIDIKVFYLALTDSL